MTTSPRSDSALNAILGSANGSPGGLAAFTYLDHRYRSSTIFPLFTGVHVQAKLSFLSYWPIKHQAHVHMLLTLRDKLGTTLATTLLSITQAASIEVQLSQLFAAHLTSSTGFTHSIEVEVFSENTPRFTYPAISLVYRGKSSISVVHACSRGYNPNEQVTDYALMLPQAGFDVHLATRGNCTNYLAFCGGSQQSYNLEISDPANANEACLARVSLRNRHRQLHVVHLNTLLPQIEKQRVANIQIRHDIMDVYPRFYVGNFAGNRVPSLTHTFFNTKAAPAINTPGMFVSNPSVVEFHDAAMMVPIFRDKGLSTRLVSYGINAELTTAVALELFDANGSPLCEKRHIEPANFNDAYFELDLTEATHILSPTVGRIVFAKLSFSSEHGGRTPRRQKFGLNVAYNGNEFQGTNICFAPNVISQPLLTKPFSRRWGPVGGSEQFMFVYCNTSLMKRQNYETNITATVYNFRGETLIRNKRVPANASLLLDPDNDAELSAFLNGGVGQVLLEAANFSNDAFFFSLIGKSVGGDHAF